MGDAVDRDLNLKWFRKYDRLIDQSYGFLIRNGLSVANVIVASAIDKHVKCQPNKIAYISENAKGTDDTILVIRNMALNDKGKFWKTIKFNKLYWSKNKDIWYHGDLVSVDSNRFWYILGRADDVIKTSWNRIGSVKIEATITAHLAVAEAMAIGVPDELKGQSIVAYVVLKREYENCKR